MPRRCAGGMRERDEVNRSTIPVDRIRETDHCIESSHHHELRDGELAHRKNKVGPQKIDLIVHPGRAVANLVGRWHAIATGRRLTRKQRQTAAK